MKTTRLHISILCSAFVASSVLTARAQIPVSGRPVPGMTAFDKIMTDFMTSNSITAGVLAISRNGRVEYARGFGWLTPTVALPENAMMRTASAVKPITAAAIRQLAADGALGSDGLNSRIFDNLVVGLNGLLSITPKPALGDTRQADITLNHLLLHQGGFDRNVDPPGDVMFKARQVASALGINSPPPVREIASYMLGQSLQWTPGTVSNLNSPTNTDAYSNYGYMLLGEVLQSFAAGGYFGFVKARIMSPALGIPSTEFELARSFPQDRNIREPGYIASGNARNVFDNEDPIDIVPTPDGGFFIEGMMAHGGVIASASAMVRFANAYHLGYSGDEIGRPITPGNPMQRSGHTGRLDGVNTLLQQREDNVVFYLAVNRTDFGDPDYAQALGARINDQLDTGGFTWPGLSADGFWANVGTEVPLEGKGSYDSPFRGFQSALDQIADGSSLRLRSSQKWTGKINKRLRFDAPEGAVRLGL